MVGDISTVYDLYVFFSLNTLLDIFRPLPGPLPENRARGNIPFWPPSHRPWRWSEF